jgi:hypothetical protein
MTGAEGTADDPFLRTSAGEEDSVMCESVRAALPDKATARKRVEIGRPTKEQEAFFLVFVS